MGSLSHASHRARSWMLGSAGAASSGRPAAPQLPQLPQSPTQQQLGPYPHPVPPAAQDSLWAAYQVSSTALLAPAFGGPCTVGGLACTQCGERGWGGLQRKGSMHLGACVGCMLHRVCSHLPVVSCPPCVPVNL